MASLSEKKAAIQVLMGEIREMNARQIKALGEAVFLNARGMEADPGTISVGGLAYQERPFDSFFLTRVPHIRGKPRVGYPVTIFTGDEKEPEPLADGDLVWLQAWFGNTQEYESYWLPPQTECRFLWDGGE